MIKVLLADDQPLVRTGFRMILEAEPDIEVAGEAGDGACAVLQCRKHVVVKMERGQHEHPCIPLGGDLRVAAIPS